MVAAYSLFSWAQTICTLDRAMSVVPSSAASGEAMRRPQA